MKNAAIKITLLLSSMMTMMAGAIVAPALPQINTYFANTPQADILTRLIITLPAIFIAFFSPVFGWLIDRYGRKQFLMLSLLIYAFGGTSGYLLNDLNSILYGRAVLGFAVAGIMTISTTLIGDYFKGDERNYFMGLQGAFIGVGGVIFISFAGFLADINWQLPFLIYLTSIPIFFLVSYFIYEPERPKKKEHKTDPKTNYSRLLVWVILVLSFIGIVFFYMLPVQIPYLLEKMPNVNNTMVGLAISSSTLSSAIVSLNFQRIKNLFSFPIIYIVAFVFIGIGYLIVAQAESYFTVIGGLITTGVGVGVYMPAGNLWMMEIAPANLRGRLIGRVSMATFLAMFLSPILVQPAINVFDVDGAFALASLILFGIALIILISVFFIGNKTIK